MKRKTRKIIYYSINIVLLILFIYLSILALKKTFLGEYISNTLLSVFLNIITILDLIVFAWCLANIATIIYGTYMWLKNYDDDKPLIDYIKNARKYM